MLPQITDTNSDGILIRTNEKIKEKNSEDYKTLWIPLLWKDQRKIDSFTSAHELSINYHRHLSVCKASLKVPLFRYCYTIKADVWWRKSNKMRIYNERRFFPYRSNIYIKHIRHHTIRNDSDLNGLKFNFSYAKCTLSGSLLERKLQQTFELTIKTNL